MLELVATKGEPIPVLNAQETPAWRALRGEILKQRESAAKRSEEAYQRVKDKSASAIYLSLGLAVLAAAVALGLNLALRSTVQKELGGDPSQVRQALQDIAHGNLVSPVVNHGGAGSLMAMVQEMQHSLQQLVSGVRKSASGIATSTD